MRASGSGSGSGCSRGSGARNGARLRQQCRKAGRHVGGSRLQFDGEWCAIFVARTIACTDTSVHTRHRQLRQRRRGGLVIVVAVVDASAVRSMEIECRVMSTGTVVIAVGDSTCSAVKSACDACTATATLTVFGIQANMPRLSDRIAYCPPLRLAGHSEHAPCTVHNNVWPEERVPDAHRHRRPAAIISAGVCLHKHDVAQCWRPARRCPRSRPRPRPRPGSIAMLSLSKPELRRGDCNCDCSIS